jgi:fatty acid desaturase
VTRASSTPNQSATAEKFEETDAAVPPRRPSAVDSERVKQLKARDNLTNWLHLAQIYFVIAGTIALAIWGSGEIAVRDLGWGWTVLVNAAAVVVLGAAQHQFGGAIHEGTHFLLFKNRRLNELISDWLAAFPLYTSTYQFRVHHLAHHQFVNDPERDPDIAQLKESGHWLDFPVPPLELLWSFLKQLSPLRLFYFTIIRAKYSAVGFDNHAYIDPNEQGSKWTLRAGIIFAVVVPIITAEATRRGFGREGAIFLAISWLLTTAFLLLVPKEAFAASRLAPVISHRATLVSRVTYFGLLYGSLTAVQLSGLAPAWRYFTLYWVLPLFTTFPLFMMLRQWVQHGNADRGRYTNTRTFLVGPAVRYAVFPWGMDYHLPHHLMASVPHYNLKQLHELMLNDSEYREKGVIVDGFFARGARGPSVVASLGPAHAPKVPERAYVDNDTLEYAELRDAAAIAREAERSAASK